MRSQALRQTERRAADLIKIEILGISDVFEDRDGWWYYDPDGELHGPWQSEEAMFDESYILSRGGE